jgi:molecular chaperone GrpE
MAQEEKENITDNTKVDETEQTAQEAENKAEAPATEENKEQSETDILKNELGEMKDKYLRLYSEFENFRKRTSKEKSDLIRTANEDVLVAVLPVLDDFERAIKAFGDDESQKATKEGVELIYQKLYKTLENKGLKPINAVGEVFNIDLHEAITQIPAPSEDMKGKVIDEIEKGYFLNEKVIRFAKVVTGA